MNPSLIPFVIFLGLFGFGLIWYKVKHAPFFIAMLKWSNRHQKSGNWFEKFSGLLWQKNNIFLTFGFDGLSYWRLDIWDYLSDLSTNDLKINGLVKHRVVQIQRRSKKWLFAETNKTFLLLHFLSRVSWPGNWAVTKNIDSTTTTATAATTTVKNELSRC